MNHHNGATNGARYNYLSGRRCRADTMAPDPALRYDVASEMASGISQQRSSTSVEPRMSGTSWASVRWDPRNVGYQPSRFSGSMPSSSLPSGVTKSGRPSSQPPGSSMTGISPGVDRYKSVLDSSPKLPSRPKYFYLSSRTPARTTLMDVRQNLRPVNKNSAPTAMSPFHDSVKAYSSAYSAAFLSAPTGFTNATSSSPIVTVGTHLATVKRSVGASSMAISNAMVQHRSILKSERPWRQRLADAAQLRAKSAENSSIACNSASYTNGKTSSIVCDSRPYMSGANSAAIQQRKIQKSTEQNLQDQLADLRNVVIEDKANSRFNRRSETSDALPRRGSNGSIFSVASRSSSASFNSMLSCMPSSIRARQSAILPGNTSTSLYGANIHPPYVSTLMSKSYSPVRSSSVFHHTNDSKMSNKQSAETVPQDAAKVSKRDESDVKETTAATNNKNVGSRNDRNAVVPLELRFVQLSLAAKASSKRLSPSPSLLKTVDKKNLPEVRKENATTSIELKKQSFSKQVLKTPIKSKESGELKEESIAATPSTKQKQQTVCEPTEMTLLTNKRTLISKSPSDEQSQKNVRSGVSTKTASQMKRDSDSRTAKTAAQLSDEERQYSAVTLFKPASVICKKMEWPKIANLINGNEKSMRSSRTAPVAGTWSSQNGEHCISHNRHLKKKSCVLKVEIVCKHFLRENVSKSSLREASNALAKEIRRSTTNSNSSVIGKLGRNTTMTKPLKDLPRPRKLENALTVLSCAFSNKKRFRLGVQKVIRPYGLKVEKLNFKCGQPKLRQTTLALNIVFRQQTRDATVKILSAMSNVKVMRAHANIRLLLAKAKRKSLTFALNKENMEITAMNKNGKEQKIMTREKKKNTLINKILTEKKLFRDVMEKENTKISARPKHLSKSATATTTLGQCPAFAKNTQLAKREQENRKSKEQIINYTVIPFVLPSESLLEEYVQRKRNELERSALCALNATALSTSVTIDTLSQSSASTSRCDSPTFTAFSTVQNCSNNKNNHKVSKSNTNLRVEKCESLKSPRITDFDLIENEKMIELLTYSSNSAMLSNAVKKKEESVVSKKSTMMKGQVELQKTQPTKQQAPVAQMAHNLRNPIDIIKKENVFDTPRSIFEEQMQSQASQLRKTSENRHSNPMNFLIVYEEDQNSFNADTGHGRTFNALADKQTVTQNFSASQQPRYEKERYTAHISLSGRQSTTSVESNNSGALDSASRSIDQMIDHARHRHHQQKNPPQNGKFKEAIDYLDQIFEDLRKECDISMANNKSVDNKPKKQHNVAETKSNGTHVATNRTLPKNSSRLPQQQHQQQQNLSHESDCAFWKNGNDVSTMARKPVYALPKEQQPLRQSQENTPKQPKKVQSDANVTETSLLLSKIAQKRKKDNRLDFTRKWLVNDSKLWDGDRFTLNFKKDDINGELSDGSENSLGSCSVEIAAINAAEKRKLAAPQINKKFTSSQSGQKTINSMPKISENKKQATPTDSKKKNGVVVIEPIRPQPYRPQPSQGSSDYDLHEMSSSDKLNGVQFRSSSHNRASSQDHYSVGSTHSQEGIKPTTSFLSINSLQRVGSSTGAFVNYPQRGSIQSLPDAVLMPQNGNNPMARAVDNSLMQKKLFATELELDSLVAELELNTYQEDTNDKRRSFPTVQAEKHITHNMVMLSEATVTSRTNSIERRRCAYPLKMHTTMSTIAGNAASIGTVIGQAAQQYKQRQQRQRLHGQNSSVSPTRRIANGLANTDSVENRRSQFRLQQISDDRNTLIDTALSKESGIIGGLAPAPYQKQLQRKISGGSSGSGSIEKASTSSSAMATNPFETINQERLKPSRVEAIQHMFEKSGTNIKESNWAQKVSAHNSNKDDSLYCEISEYKKDKSKNYVNHRSSQRNVEKPKLRSVNIHPVFCQDERKISSNRTRFQKSAQLQINNGNHVTGAPTFTNAQQPANGPLKRPLLPESGRGSMKVPTIVTTPAANADGKSDITDVPPLTPNANRHSHTDSFFGGRLSTASSSRAPSLNSTNVNDNEDGFYDNISADQQLLPSTLSDVGDNASLSSQHLPPPSSSSSVNSQHKIGGRQFINKLIRRIGGMSVNAENPASTDMLDSGRPPINAASSISLNKLGNEEMPQHSNGDSGLMKSNSLSYEPWKSTARLSTESVNMIGDAQSEREDAEKNGFGNRLKQTIFGSKRRVAAHS